VELLQQIWERIVGIVSKEQDGPLRNCGLTASRGKRFLPFQSAHGNSQAHLPSYSMGLQALFPINKQPRREADHSPPSSAKVKMNGAMPCLHPTCLHSVHSNNFTFICWQVSVYCHNFPVPRQWDSKLHMPLLYFNQGISPHYSWINPATARKWMMTRMFLKW